MVSFGGLYSQKLAHRYGRAQDINCPLCNLEDGGGHILGGCAHRDMRALYIERHNAAGRRIAHEIRNGAHGNHVIVGDVGSAEKCQGLDLHSTRISEWLLSDQDCDTVDSNRSMMRPDLMVINNTNHTRRLQEARSTWQTAWNAPSRAS